MLIAAFQKENASSRFSLIYNLLKLCHILNQSHNTL